MWWLGNVSVNISNIAIIHSWHKCSRRWYTMWMCLHFAYIQQEILSANIFRQLCLENCRQTNDRLFPWKSFWRFDIILLLLILLLLLYYDRIDIGEGLDLAKSNNSKECMISPYWCFNDGFNI